MKILAPLLKYDYGIESRGPSLERTYFVPALSASNAEVVPFWLEEHGYPDDIEGLQVRLMAAAERFRPDLVFLVLMRDEVKAATVRELSSRYRTLNWFADDQWRFDSFTRHIAPLLTYSVTVDKYSIPRYHDLGLTNVILSQWAHDSPDSSLPSPDELTLDVTFVGTWSSVRQWYVDRLTAAGVDVQCFGSGWAHGRVTFERMREIARTSKVSLNLSNSQPSSVDYVLYLIQKTLRAAFGKGRLRTKYWQNLRHHLGMVRSLLRSHKRVEQLKARNFELSGWGGFQVSQFCLGIEDYFTAGKEITLFSTPEELVTVVKYYLVETAERETIRAAGMKRVSNQTYTMRLSKVLLEIERETRDIHSF